MEQRKPSNKTYLYLLLLGALALALLFYLVHTETWSLQIFCGIVYGIFLFFFIRRISIDLRMRLSKWYGVLTSALICFFILLVFGVAVLLDQDPRLSDFVIVPCAIVLSALVALLCFHFMETKNTPVDFSNKSDALEETFDYEDVQTAFEDDNEIEFAYKDARYLLIFEEFQYRLKRIVSANPYTYEILVSLQSAEACLDAAKIDGIPLCLLWKDAYDIKIYK
jgi:glucan phosphoethanolaminetransferase (alkaline phosphatase superfamily)